MFENIIGSHKPDILDCISNLSSDEVFTPPVMVNKILDLLPNEVWANPKLKFLDPACKSGVFLREIAKRLLNGLSEAIPNEDERREHIYSNMLYGIAITELTGYIARRSLYYSKLADSKYSVIKMADEQGNIRYSRGKHSYVKGRCIHCGSPEGVLDRGDSLENYAYQFIHGNEVFKMKFDVIVGNPPYQLQDGGGSGSSAVPIYQHFIEQAKKLSPKYISFIVPSRWFSGGKGLDSFREEMLNDRRIKNLVDYSDASECFPGVDIAGGVCYFLWDREYNGDCDIKHIHNGRVDESIRPLNEFDTFIRDSTTLSILKKVKSSSKKSIFELVSSRKPFGLDSKVRAKSTGDLTIISSAGEGKFPFDEVLSGHDLINVWKVLVSKASYDHAGQSDKDGKRRILAKVDVIGPKVICTETYLIVGPFESKGQADNMASYLKTKFVRFLISSLLLGQNIAKDKFSLIPSLDMNKKWADDELFELFGLDVVEVNHINSLIKEMV